MTGVVVWPYPIRVVAERIPEEDRPGFIALRWVRPNPVRRVLAQMRYPEGSIELLRALLPYSSRGVSTNLRRVGLWWQEDEEDGRMSCLLREGHPTADHAVAHDMGQVLRLASDRKHPYDPAKEAEDLLATLITGTGAVPVADRLLASLDKEP